MVATPITGAIRPRGTKDIGAHEFQSANGRAASPTNLRVIGLIDGN